MEEADGQHPRQDRIARAEGAEAGKNKQRERSRHRHHAPEPLALGVGERNPHFPYDKGASPCRNACCVGSVVPARAAGGPCRGKRDVGLSVGIG